MEIQRMNNIRKKLNYRLDTKKGFGNIVDIINNINFFQIVYCIMLTFYYILHQNEKSSFQPVLYLSSLILLVFIVIFESIFVEIWKVALGELIVAFILIYKINLDGSKIIFGACCILLCLKSIYRHRFRVSHAATYSERYRTQNRAWIFMFIMILLFAIHYFIPPDSEVLQKIVSPVICEYYMLSSFAVFIISMIANKYAFKYYEYYRQELKDNGSLNGQLGRSLIIIIITTIILISLIFLIFGDLYIPFLENIKGFAVKVFATFIWKLFNIDISAKNGGNGQIKSMTSSGSALQRKNYRSNNTLTSIVPILVVFIIIGAVIYLAWKLYKVILSNYKIDSDEVEFIKNEKDNIYFEKIKKENNKIVFGKSNVDKIRKYYYNIILRKIKKYNQADISYYTPNEVINVLSHTKEEKEFMPELINIYEKARYSNQEIEDKEVEDVKDISIKISK